MREIYRGWIDGIRRRHHIDAGRSIAARNDQYSMLIGEVYRREWGLIRMSTMVKLAAMIYTQRLKF